MSDAFLENRNWYIRYLLNRGADGDEACVGEVEVNSFLEWADRNDIDLRPNLPKIENLNRDCETLYKQYESAQISPLKYVKLVTKVEQEQQKLRTDDDIHMESLCRKYLAVPEDLKLTATQENILVFAFRYALGRRSTAPSIVCDELKQVWRFLSDATQRQIKREIQEAISFREAGDSIDELTWREILELK